MIAIALAAALLPPSWRKWPWSVDISPARGVVSLNVPLGVEDKARSDLSDLRVVDERGDEIPFEIAIHRGATGVRWKEAVIDDYGFVPGKYTGAVADAGSSAAHDFSALEISSPKQHFSTYATILVSDDRRTWRIVAQNTPLFNYQDENLGSNLRIAFPPQHSRWYSIHILAARAPFPIDGIRLATGSAVLPELQRYTIPKQRVKQRGSATLITVDTKIANLPVSLIRLDAATPRFSRDAALERSDDAVNWYPFETVRFERTPQDDRRTLTIDESQARFWRLTIENGNDAPLSRPVLELWGTPRHVVFAAKPQHRYQMLFGNRSADAPLYDFARTQNPGALQSPTHVSVGPIESNVAPVAAVAPPWSESHPWLLWGALGVAIVTIGGFAARALTMK